MHSTFRGYEIFSNGEGWFYSDTNKQIDEEPARPCGYCGKSNTPEGYDGCIGFVPGAIHVCCGHGDMKAAYIQYPDRCISGSDIVDIVDQELGE